MLVSPSCLNIYKGLDHHYPISKTMIYQIKLSFNNDKKLSNCNLNNGAKASLEKKETG